MKREHLRVRGGRWDDTGWELVTDQSNTPQQNNGTDCGVFMCSFAECVASGQELTFRQTDVRDQREHLGVSILEGRIRGWRGWEG